MKRESIIKLMWISLGIHVGHFLLEGIVAMGQRQIMALSMAPDFEGTVFPVPYLLAGSAVYLPLSLIHISAILRFLSCFPEFLLSVHNGTASCTLLFSFYVSQ